MKYLYIILSLVLLTSCGKEIDFTGKWVNENNNNWNLSIVKNGDFYLIKEGNKKTEMKAVLKGDNLEILLDDISMMASINSKDKLILKSDEGNSTYIRYSEFAKGESKRSTERAKKDIKKSLNELARIYTKRNNLSEYFVEKMKDKNELNKTEYNDFQKIFKTSSDFEITKGNVEKYLNTQEKFNTIFSNVLIKFERHFDLKKEKEYQQGIVKMEGIMNEIKPYKNRYNILASKTSKYLNLPKVKIKSETDDNAPKVEFN